MLWRRRCKCGYYCYCSLYSEYRNTPPTHSTLDQVTEAIKSSYPVHRHRPSSLSSRPPPPPPPHATSYSSQTSSSILHDATQPHPHNPHSLRRSHTTDSLVQSGHQVGSRYLMGHRAGSEAGEARIHGRSLSSKYERRGSADTGLPPRGYPAHSSGPPPLPPKGISTMHVYQWDLAAQGSQPDYRGEVQEYYPNETTSEHSLSDSTQTSDISEPTYRRPRYIFNCVYIKHTPLIKFHSLFQLHI